MKQIDNTQIYNILANLNSLESSYLEFSRFPMDFTKGKTFLDFFNHSLIQKNDLFRFYFPSITGFPATISISNELSDQILISPEYDFAIYKVFNFPCALRHKCNYFTGIYMLNGSGTLILDTGTFSLNTGDFVLLPPQIYYYLQTPSDSLCVYYNFRRSFIASEYQKLFLDHPILTRFITHALSSGYTMPYLILHSADDEATRTLVLDMFTEYINQTKYSNAAMTGYLLLFFITILRNPKTTIETPSEISRKGQQYDQIRTYLQKYYPTATLSSAAEYMHFSKQYICKIVKEETGNTFHNLLTDIRLKMVVQYLSETELSLEKIAELCGFAAVAHLSRVFKEHYGLSPSVYRKNLK